MILEASEKFSEAIVSILPQGKPLEENYLRTLLTMYLIPLFNPRGGKGLHPALG